MPAALAKYFLSEREDFQGMENQTDPDVSFGWFERKGRIADQDKFSERYQAKHTAIERSQGHHECVPWGARPPDLQINSLTL